MVERLNGVSVLWITNWWDGPVEGMASFDGRDCWFTAIFDEEADEYTSPRRCELYELSAKEREQRWARHRHWEQAAGGNSCFHDASPDPSLKPGWSSMSATPWTEIENLRPGPR